MKNAEKRERERKNRRLNQIDLQSVPIIFYEILCKWEQFRNRIFKELRKERGEENKEEVEFKRLLLFLDRARCTYRELYDRFIYMMCIVA